MDLYRYSNKNKILVRGYMIGTYELFTYLFYTNTETNLNKIKLFDDLNITYNPTLSVTHNLIQSKYRDINHTNKEFTLEEIDNIQNTFMYKRNKFYISEILFVLLVAVIKISIIDKILVIILISILHSHLAKIILNTYLKEKGLD